jgi:hypothetical protein
MLTAGTVDVGEPVEQSREVARQPLFNASTREAERHDGPRIPAPPRSIHAIVGASPPAWSRALVVADHLRDRHSESTAKRARESEGGAQLRPVGEELVVARADLLDPDGRVVQADAMAASEREGKRVIDRAVGIDKEVSADIGGFGEVEPGTDQKQRSQSANSEGRKS